MTGNAIKDLLDYADAFSRHLEADDWVWIKAQSAAPLADLVAALDLALTGKLRSSSIRPSDIFHAVEALQGCIWTIQLSDGGYSWVTLDLSRMFESPLVLDRISSLPGVLDRWDRLMEEIKPCA